MKLITYTDKGFYCEQAQVYIDPWKPVKKALITHAHSDHARWGHAHYLAHKDSASVLRLRLGNDLPLQTAAYGEKTVINGVTFSFHPAGHIPGSSQIRAEYKGEVWVISGDYKTTPDGLVPQFEPIACQHFVTESTFGLPIYQWKDEQTLMEEVVAWWAHCKEEGKNAVIGAYSLGKAQRIIHGLKHTHIPIYCHGAVASTNEALEQDGWDFGKWNKIGDEHSFKGGGHLIIAPPSALGSNWMKRFGQAEMAFASGWMTLRGARRRQGLEKGFEISDHADWPGLIDAINATGAEHIYVTHGYQETFARYLREEMGLDAVEVKTQYGEEEKE